MANFSDPDLDDRRKPTPLTPTATLMRLGIIGLVLLLTALTFVYCGGFLDPGRLTRDQLIGAFVQLSGPQAGFRLNHAKGVCVAGWFAGSGAAQPYSNAAVFKPGKVAVVGRLAIAGGLPFQPDDPAKVRSMALRFMLPGANEWRTGMNNIPVFPVNTVEAFYQQLVAAKPVAGTGKPDPAAMAQFIGAHPEVAHALSLIKGREVSSGFADSTYNSLNAFLLISEDGQVTPVRWATVPVTPIKLAAAGSVAPNAVFAELVSTVHQQPVSWHLILTLGEAGDPIDDATLPWPKNRKQIDAGLLTLDQVSSEDNGGACTDINYDPLVLPTGIRSSDDPLLSARSSAYARSFTLRESSFKEKKPSAVETNQAAGS